jgi:ABC-type Fe3+ transport system permease subunit
MAEFLTALIISGIFFAMFFGVIYAGKAYSNRAYAQNKPKKQNKAGKDEKGMGCVWTLFLFFLLFLPTWGVGLWSRSAGGPEIAGVKVLNYLFIALIFTVLIAAIHAAETRSSKKDDESSLNFLHVFLWIFLGLMGIAIIAGLLL